MERFKTLYTGQSIVVQALPCFCVMLLVLVPTGHNKRLKWTEMNYICVLIQSNEPRVISRTKKVIASFQIGILCNKSIKDVELLQETIASDIQIK